VSVIRIYRRQDAASPVFAVGISARRARESPQKKERTDAVGIRPLRE
jgi:hypothetical protein